MVTRKPVANGGLVPAPLQQAVHTPPYPTSDSFPTSHTPAHDQDDATSQRSRTSSVSSHDTWNSGFSDEEEDAQHRLPDALRAGRPRENSDKDTDESRLPSSLRPGPPNAISRNHVPSHGAYPSQQNPWAVEDSTNATAPTQPPPPAMQSNNPHNPYLRMQTTGPQSPYSGDNSQAAWGNDAAAPPPQPPPPAPLAPPPAPPGEFSPVELPTVRTPTEAMASMSLDAQLAPNQSTSTLPQGLQAPLIPEKTGSSPSISRQHSGTSSNPWQEDLDRRDQDRTANIYTPPAPATPPPALSHQQPESLIQVEAADPPAQPPRPADSLTPSEPPRPADNLTPSEPPRPADNLTPSEPPRPAPLDISAATRPAAASPETPGTRAKRQRNETYQIKQINWFDASAGPSGKLRCSPIMTQNANGPCPLLALVNALTLSTPEHVNTALVDALRSREQVSLGLLLDAVFEELARRSEITDKQLPDVGDLYSFLITLHTGMNVNPRFVTSGAPHVGSVDAEVSAAGNLAKPGVFEETREMILYSTFDIPLIHGWIPPPQSPAYQAFDRSAKTFDEALNIQFMQEDLEQKLQTGRLSEDEQRLYQDVILVKQFLADYPTQLTDYGLDIMSKSLKPGQIAILFRNDHFATLYKEPKTGALMTLVTDAGYSSHDEIIWESLVDVNGAASELFSGDFRPVGNNSATGPAALPTSSNTEHGWETVQPRNNRARPQNPTGSNQNQIYAPPPGPPPGRTPPTSSHTDLAVPPAQGTQRKTSEQEDHDLALALQLQEEEEDRERQERASRQRREDELSRQFLDRERLSTSSPTSPTEQRPPIPPRRSNLQGQGPPRDSAPSPSLDAPYLRASENSDDQPPTYEQAASDRPFRPPGSMPRRPGQGDPLGALNALNAQQRAHSMNHQPAYAQASQSNMSVNTLGSVHPAAANHRRRSSVMAGNGAPGSANRMRRTQSQSVAGNAPPDPAGPVYGARTGAAYYPGNVAQAGQPSRVAEQEKCCVM